MDPFHCRGVCVGRSKSQSKSFTIQTVKWIGFNQRVRFQTLRFCLETRSQAHEEGCGFDFRRGGLQCLSSQSVSFCLSHCHVMSVSQSVCLTGTCDFQCSERKDGSTFERLPCCLDWKVLLTLSFVLFSLKALLSSESRTATPEETEVGGLRKAL